MIDNTTETARLLVVSRESAVLRPVWSIAEPNSWHVEVAVSAWDAMERMQSGVAPHLLVLDLPRGDGDCLHILRWLRRLRPDMPVIVICCPEDAERKKEATRLGAQEVLIRPFDEARLESVIYRYLAPENDRGEIASEDIEQVGPDSFFVSASPVSQKLRAQIQLLAEADIPVLILGEPGTGKDNVARLIHKLSVRSGFKFLKVNCADMPSELLEAELFDREWAVAGNDRNTSGKTEQAGMGTIFLEEITEMPLGLQSKLMELLKENSLRSGTEKSSLLDVRILAATTANLERALAEKKLLEGLYYRLSAFNIHVPPLRQRKSEIPVLLRHSMHRLAKQYSLPPRELPPALIEACQRYSWPGNLKELESFAKRYLVAGDTDLAFSDLEPVHAANGGRSRGPNGGDHNNTFANGNGTLESPSSSTSLKSLVQSIKCEAERNAIASVLQKTGWNRKAAARLLQVSYRTLLYKIDQYHLTASDSFQSPLVREPSAGMPSKGVERQSPPGQEQTWKQFQRSRP